MKGWVAGGKVGSEEVVGKEEKATQVNVRQGVVIFTTSTVLDSVMGFSLSTAEEGRTKKT